MTTAFRTSQGLATCWAPACWHFASLPTGCCGLGCSRAAPWTRHLDPPRGPGAPSPAPTGPIPGLGRPLSSTHLPGAGHGGGGGAVAGGGPLNLQGHPPYSSGDGPALPFCSLHPGHQKPVLRFKPPKDGKGETRPQAHPEGRGLAPHHDKERMQELRLRERIPSFWLGYKNFYSLAQRAGPNSSRDLSAGKRKLVPST